MLSKEQLAQTLLCALPTGEVLGSQDGMQTYQIVFTSNTVHKDYANLLGASALLYKNLCDIGEGLEELVHILELDGKHDLAHAVVQLRASALIATAAATDGLIATADRHSPPQPPQKSWPWPKKGG